MDEARQAVGPDAAEGHLLVEFILGEGRAGKGCRGLGKRHHDVEHFLEEVRAGGAFVQVPIYDVATLTEAFRRAVLEMFVGSEPTDIETARGSCCTRHA